MKDLIKICFLLLALLQSATVSAYQFEVNGICYDIVNGGACVTFNYSSPHNYGWGYDVYSDYSGYVTIPESVVYGGNTFIVNSIGDYAFCGCDGLIGIDIPNTVTKIGHSAFYYCYELSHIVIPNSVTYIDTCAFYGCVSARFSLPNNIETINSDAFGNTVWYSVYIPASVTTIEGAPFGGSWDASSPDSEYPGYVYYPTGYIVDVMNPYFASESDLLFNKNKAILLDIPMGISGTINIPNSVKECQDNFTLGQSDVRINTDIKTWYEIDFEYAPKYSFLKWWYDEDDNYQEEECDLVYSGNNAFQYKGDVTIPSNVEKIGDRVYSGNKKLTSISIPSSVFSIGCESFLDCYRITSINIPNSIVAIGENAFSGCSGLTDVYCYITNPSLVATGSMSFYLRSNDYSGRTLHVPAGSLEAYQADSNWSSYFGNIVEMEPETILATSIGLNVTTAGLNEGATLQLTATVLPEDATNKDVTWASSDPCVATIDGNGLVTTHSVGTATITAMTTDGSNLSASCTVTLLPVGVKGDVNSDWNITIADVTALIDMLLSGN